MTEYDNVFEVLEQMILVNNSVVYEITEDGVKRTATIDDLKDINMELLYNLIGLLGIGDFILQQKSQSANWLKQNYLKQIIS